MTRSSVTCGSAKYKLAAIAGIRVASVREATVAKLFGFSALLVVCNFAVCAAVDSFRAPLLYALAVAAACLGWAYYWAPETHYVMLNLGGHEVALVRYPTKGAAIECADGIQAAADSVGSADALAKPASRP